MSRFSKLLNSLCYRLASLSFLVLCCFACSTLKDPYIQKMVSWLNHEKPLRVLCTTEMVEALVQEIGGEFVQTLSLVYGELDPHSYQMVKGDSEKMAKAELIFGNGLELEHGPSLKAALDRHPNVTLLGDVLYKQHPQLFIHHENVIDPHLWLDVHLFAQLCPIIADTLSSYDPVNQTVYQERAYSLKNRLLEFHVSLLEKFHQIKSNKRFLVTSHQAFYYLARAYLADAGEMQSEFWKERFCAPEGLAPESQISLQRISQIVDHIIKHQVSAAFLEVNVNTDALFKIKEILNNKNFVLKLPNVPLYSDSMPELKQGEQITHTSALDRYFEMINHNSRVILGAWSE